MDSRNVGLAHMRQHQILLVADADFVMAVLFGQISDQTHLVCGGVARRPANGFQRNRDNAIGRIAVFGHIGFDKGAQHRVGLECFLIGLRTHIVENRRLEPSGDAFDQFVGRMLELTGNAFECGFGLFAEFVQPALMQQDLDTRLVFVVAAASQIVDLKDRFQIGQQITLRQEVA